MASVHKRVFGKRPCDGGPADDVIRAVVLGRASPPRHGADLCKRCSLVGREAEELSEAKSDTKPRTLMIK